VSADRIVMRDRTVTVWIEQWDFSAPCNVPREHIALLAADAASQANASHRLPVAAWRVALDQLTAGSTIAGRYVLPVYDGDRPAPAYPSRNWARYPILDALGEALKSRWLEWEYFDHHESNAERTRKTHRAIHEALADEDTSGCKWCQRARR
jgi:hypothetical protein